MVGSPMPPEKPPHATITVSTLGNSASRISSWRSKFRTTTRPSLMVIS